MATKKVRKVAEVEAVETNVVEAVETVETEKPKKRVKKEKPVKKARATVTQFTNEELANMFKENGCLAKGKPVADSVVYNTFGTGSRILQQKGSYQLLLTNGHKKVKNEVVACDNDDTKRFMEWADGLGDERQFIQGMDVIDKVALSKSELPRERSVKITNVDLLVNFIQYMSTFPENYIGQEAVAVE